MSFKRPHSDSPSIEKELNGGQKRSHTRTKVCLVCGDRASIFNYGGLSCQSCKTFFRRNASHPEVCDRSFRRPSRSSSRLILVCPSLFLQSHLWDQHDYSTTMYGVSLVEMSLGGNDCSSDPKRSSTHGQTFSAVNRHDCCYFQAQASRYSSIEAWLDFLTV